MKSAQDGPHAQSHERLTAVAADIDKLLAIDGIEEEVIFEELVMCQGDR